MVWKSLGDESVNIGAILDIHEQREEKAMVGIFDVIAHLSDGLPTKAFGQSIGNSFRELTVSFLEYRKNRLPLVENLKVCHGVTEDIEAPLKIQALYHFVHEFCVTGVVESFEHVEELFATRCQGVRVQRVDLDVGWVRITTVTEGVSR